MLRRPLPCRAAPGAIGPDLVVPLGVAIDNLSVIMFVMVTFIATLIHIYSMGYMHDDPRYPRFFTYLSLFCFSMLGLVASPNVFMIFIFWELVGVCSYLLIGFWYEEKSNCDAANKAFIVNRVGDVGMLHGPRAALDQPGNFQLPGDQPGAAQHVGKVEPSCDRREAAEDVVELMPDPATLEVAKDPVTGKPREIPYWMLTLAGLGIFAGCVGQECTVSAPRVAAGCHGGADAGLGLDPRGDDGGGRGVSGRAVFPGVHGRRASVHRVHRRDHAVHRGDDRDGADRLQEGPCLFDGQPARIHDARPGGRRLGGRALSPGHARVLQGPVVPGRRQRLSQRSHLRDAGAGGLLKKMPRTGYAMLVGTLAISGVPFFSGFYSKDAILAAALARVLHESRAFPAVPASGCRGGVDGFLHVPDVVLDVRRRASRVSRRRPRPCTRTFTTTNTRCRTRMRTGTGTTRTRRRTLTRASRS